MRREVHVTARLRCQADLQQARHTRKLNTTKQAKDDAGGLCSALSGSYLKHVGEQEEEPRVHACSQAY